MGEVFLIGFMAEDRERVVRLKDAIESYGWGVDWPDAPPDNRLWLHDLRPRIARARCAVVAWTAASAASRWTAVAADLAQERRTLVSVLLDPLEPPRAFRGAELVDLADWAGDPLDPDLETLAKALGELLGSPPNDLAPRGESARGVVADLALPGPPILPGPWDPRSRPAPHADPGAPETHAVAAWRPVEQPGLPSGSLAEVEDDAPRDGLAFVPGIYGWALAWTLALSAIGLYARAGIDLASAATVTIGNPLYSAVAGASVGLLGAAFTLYALHRQGVRLSAPETALALAGWAIGGGAGLVACARLDLPILGVASGIVGFEIGWVVCWVIGAAVGCAFSWLALRRCKPRLRPRDLALVAGGFSAGAVGGWIGSWLVLSMPAMLLAWAIGKLVSALATPEVGEAMTELMSIALIGAGGGAVYGLGGGLLLSAVLTRSEGDSEGRSGGQSGGQSGG